MHNTINQLGNFTFFILILIMPFHSNDFSSVLICYFALYMYNVLRNILMTIFNIQVYQNVYVLLIYTIKVYEHYEKTKSMFNSTYLSLTTVPKYYCIVNVMIYIFSQTLCNFKSEFVKYF